MKRFLLIVGVLLVVVISFTVGAQEIGPGEGAPIIEGNFSGSQNFSSLNPLRCSGTDCSVITALLFPNLLGVDENGVIVPDAQDAVTKTWEVSEDGLTYTFHLRDDLYWSDGVQITANDLAFSIEAIFHSEEAEVAGGLSYLAGEIASYEVVDDFTLIIVLNTAACTNLVNISFIPAVPLHVFGDDYTTLDYTTLNGHDFDTNPGVTSGVFDFLELIPGERVALSANQDYLWSMNDQVIPQGYLYVDVPDQTVQIERFLAGELSLVSAVPTASREQIRAAENVQYYEYPGNTWGFIALNLANPDNPQPGMDEAGAIIPQDPHPIFGDARVRRAMWMAMDVVGIIEAGMFGEGYPLPSYDIISSWAYDDTLATVPYDVDAAGALLDEAGWTMGDDGVRECHGCLYAEEGAKFSFELITNEGNEARGRMGVMAQDQLRQVGIEVIFTPMDFNTMVDLSVNQTYDAYLLGWNNGFPYDPDLSWLFLPEQDAPGFGYNDVSYYNPEFVDLINQAKNVPGCDTAARAELYHEMQRIFQEDAPYIMIYSNTGMYAASSDTENWVPYPNQLRRTISGWVRQP